MTSITEVLRAILLEGKGRTQADIQSELACRGFSSSQSKISRLLHQIGAVKVVDPQGKTHYRMPHEVGLLHELMPVQEKHFIREWVLSVVASDALIVMHTTPGAAGVVARILDQHRVSLEILGTIAGDDTIFVAPKKSSDVINVRNLILELFEL